MATLTRQPFAPLDGARLQSLTSLKNRQNAISNAPTKRKASEVDVDDSENVDPILFAKRSKGSNVDGGLAKDFFKPSAFVLTKAASPAPAPSTPSFAATARAVFAGSPSSVPLPAARPRTMLQPKSPAARLNSNLRTSSTPLTAPAGRSPSRGSKRVGILSKSRTRRVDPPSFGLGSSVPFSLDAALKGSIPSYSGSFRASAKVEPSSLLSSSWDFDIHEDTPEQEMTNLLQHHTCTLDISSDEESERRASRERAEGRDKENVPPVDDVSQTSTRSFARDSLDDMVVEKQRGPLAEMNVADYYAEGCDEASVFVVPADDDEEAETVVGEGEPLGSLDEPEAPVCVFDENAEFPSELPAEPQVTLADVEAVNVDEVMGKEEAAKAAVLQPMEGTGESFVLWESGSAKDATSAPASPRPEPEPLVLEEPAAPEASDVVAVF